MDHLSRELHMLAWRGDEEIQEIRELLEILEINVNINEKQFHNTERHNWRIDCKRFNCKSEISNDTRYYQRVRSSGVKF